MCASAAASRCRWCQRRRRSPTKWRSRCRIGWGGTEPEAPLTWVKTAWRWEELPSLRWLSLTVSFRGNSSSRRRRFACRSLSLFLEECQQIFNWEILTRRPVVLRSSVSDLTFKHQFSGSWCSCFSWSWSLCSWSLIFYSISLCELLVLLLLCFSYTTSVLIGAKLDVLQWQTGKKQSSGSVAVLSRKLAQSTKFLLQGLQVTGISSATATAAGVVSNKPNSLHLS